MIEESYKDEMVKKGIRPCISIGCPNPAYLHIGYEEKGRGIAGVCPNHILDFFEQWVIAVKEKNVRENIKNLKVIS